jgi:hypothetical protein
VEPASGQPLHRVAHTRWRRKQQDPSGGAAVAARAAGRRAAAAGGSILVVRGRRLLGDWGVKLYR